MGMDGWMQARGKELEENWERAGGIVFNRRGWKIDWQDL